MKKWFFLIVNLKAFEIILNIHESNKKNYKNVKLYLKLNKVGALHSHIILSM